MRLGGTGTGRETVCGGCARACVAKQVSLRAQLQLLQETCEMGNGESKAASEESNSRSDSRPPQAAPTADRQISMEELALHNKKSDCWMLIGGVVYDVSKFLSAHPGGSKPLEENAGGDATKVFKDIGAYSASACSPPPQSLFFSYISQCAGHPKDSIDNAIRGNLVVRIGVIASVISAPTVDSSAQKRAKADPAAVVQASGPIRVGELRVFPIKSCGSAAALDKLIVDDLGPQHDRCLMVCQNPHWNTMSTVRAWQHTWGAITPRTPTENPATNEKVDGSSLLLVHVAVNHDDCTVIVSSKNAARPMSDLRVAIKPPADAPLIENVQRLTPHLAVRAHPFPLPCHRSHVGTLMVSKPSRSSLQAVGSQSTPHPLQFTVKMTGTS